MEKFDLLLAVFLVVLPSCIDSTGQGRVRPTGLFWGSGASAAFVDDSIPLIAFYMDSGGRPIGAPRPAVTWQSSDSTVIRVLSDSLLVAFDTGSAILTATTLSGPALVLSFSMIVLPRMTGRMIWIRQEAGSQPLDPLGLALRDFPGQKVVHVPGFGGGGSGRARLPRDRRIAATYGPRPASSTAFQALYLLDLEAGSSRILLDSMPGHQIWPVWLPGDTLIAFLANRTGAWEVWTVRADGTDARRRTNLSAPRPPFFDVAPDGNLVIVLPKASGGELWELTLAGDSVRRFSPSLNVWDWPSVSPDGQVIAYVAGTSDSPTLGALNQVWMVNRDGSSPRRLVPPRPVVTIHDGTPSTQIAQTLSPSWTSDGAYVLIEWTVDPFLQSDGRFYSTLGEIYAVRVADGRAIRLTRWGLLDAQAAFR